VIQAAKRGRGNVKLAIYLLQAGVNEEVTVLPARGVVAADLPSQLQEMVARTAHGRTHKPVLHLHVDPSTEWTEQQYEHHLELYEAEFGLTGQPRLAVQHRKHGRGHRHYIWTIVRPDGRMVSLSNDYARRERISRILEFELGEPHVAGRHNRAVVAALRREGRVDVVESMEAAGLLAVERPVARQSSAQRKQEARTRVRQEIVERIATAAWHNTAEGSAFERALEAHGLALAMGDDVPVLVDRTGSAHSLRRLIGRKVRGDGGRRLSVAEVQRRIAGLLLRPLSAVRQELQLAALVGDVDLEMAMFAEPVEASTVAVAERHVPGGSASAVTDSAEIATVDPKDVEEPPALEPGIM
jgi:hypothetical protein